MSIRVLPAASQHFPDVAAVLGRKEPASSVCWCLSHRLDAATDRALVGPERSAYVQTLCRRDVAPGVLAERAGFTTSADTSAVSGGFPRILVRLPLPGGTGGA